MSLVQCHALLPEWKIFLRGNEESWDPCEERSPNKLSESLSGEEAQRAYQDVLSLESSKSSGVQSQPQSITSVKKAKHGRVPSLNTVMRRIEANDIKGVAEAIESNSSLINAVDPFGWSLLMCAAFAGAEEIVKLLLDAGADTQTKDKRGDSCLSLAKQNSHSKIVALIINARRPRIDNAAVSHPDLKLKHSISSCEMCSVSFQSCDMQKHLTSTIHLLNCNRASNRTYYSLPENNRGYQLMLKTGWNRDHGLGPKEDGRKLPLKTVLKKDRRGVGASKQTPRVTHFSAYDTKAVSVVSLPVKDHKARYSHKVQQSKDAQKQKWKERMFRREFS